MHACSAVPRPALKVQPSALRPHRPLAGVVAVQRLRCHARRGTSRSPHPAIHSHARYYSMPGTNMRVARCMCVLGRVYSRAQPCATQAHYGACWRRSSRHSAACMPCLCVERGQAVVVVGLDAGAARLGHHAPAQLLVQAGVAVSAHTCAQAASRAGRGGAGHIASSIQ